MKVSISMTLFPTFITCLVMVCLLVYIIDHLWMTSTLFDVNMYFRFFSISKFVNLVISDPLVHKVLKNRKLFHVDHVFVGLIMCLVLFKNRTNGFSMFISPFITFVFT